MYLRALEIQGFKSFPEKTRLTFEKPITAIVGPNGSGKSNISDAIIWVMGEQRSRALRGGKMEDVIFGGTEKRSPMGFAQVSLILDNSAGLFNIDAPEVVITRRYYRSGESEYYLNRESVRLRDITELLMDTGLGRDGYSVIGQGRIAEIVSARSTDRREVFEEAAGIARYRRRKEEAERKLERTDENLVRINDKIDELEMQVSPLREQAEKARRYLILRDEQRSLEISVWMENLDRLQARAEAVNADYEQAKSGLERAERELNEVYAKSERCTEKMRRCDVEAEDLRARQSEEEALAAEAESAVAVLRANLEHNRESIARLEDEINERSGRAESIQCQLDEQAARLEQIHGEKLRCEGEIAAALAQTQENAAAAGRTEQRISELAARENSAMEALAQKQTMLTMLADHRRELSERAAAIDAERAAGEEKYAAAGAQLRQAQTELDAAKRRLQEINNVINGHRLLISGREKRAEELGESLNRLTVELRSAQARAAMLEEMEKEFEGMGKAVKTVMRQSGRGALRGVFGPVANLLTVDERYALAIETALGGAMQNIVVDTQESGKAAIEMLKRGDGGRATFLPLSTIKPASLRRVPEGEDGFVGVAAQLVEYDKRFENIFLNLLGRTVVAETLGSAVRMSKMFDNQLRIVTLDGQLINAGGSMTGGSSAKNAGLLSRANELKKLRANLEKLTRGEADTRARFSEAQRELTAAKYELEQAASEQGEAAELVHRWESAAAQCRVLQSAADEALEALEHEKAGLSARINENQNRSERTGEEISSLESELAKVRAEAQELSGGREEFEKRRAVLSEKLAALRESVASLEAERDATVRARTGLTELLEAVSGDGEQRRRSIDQTREKNAAIERELDVSREQARLRREKVAEIKSGIERINARRMELEGQRTRCEKDGQDKNRQLLDMQSVCSRFEQKKLAAEMEEKSIVDKLWDSYELSRSAAQEQRRSVEDLDAATKRINELRREIGRLGNVNIGAIDEYERVSERYEFLNGQRSDVKKAKKELEKIISELTGQMKEIFTDRFKAINASFKEVFLELFGGGRASLELEDEENVLECGIEIKVQPPGKAVTTISLLSGGEKSFVAITLYFAIMKVRPTPFCIMDEIDAALDEANVIRYAEYMRSMSAATQFIAITHHRGTMEEADMLYGVTMQEKGVTTVISVDLDEAEKNAAN